MCSLFSWYECKENILPSVCGAEGINSDISSTNSKVSALNNYRFMILLNSLNYETTDLKTADAVTALNRSNVMIKETAL